MLAREGLKSFKGVAQKIANGFGWFGLFGFVLTPVLARRKSNVESVKCVVFRCGWLWFEAVRGECGSVEVLVVF